jgi:hypothetical protein
MKFFRRKRFVWSKQGYPNFLTDDRTVVVLRVNNGLMIAYYECFFNIYFSSVDDEYVCRNKDIIVNEF